MFKFKLPDIGEGVTEGEIIKWLVSEGQTVKKDQEMVEIMTDKVNISIPSPVEGKVLKLVYPAGKVVKVGEEIIEIDDGKPNVEEKKEPVKPIHEEKPEKQTVPGTETHNKEKGGENNMDEKPGERKALATPTIRRLARERNIDIDLVKPTGPNGRITIEDLDRTEKELKERKETKVETPPPAAEPSKEQIQVAESNAPEAKPLEPVDQNVAKVSETPAQTGKAVASESDQIYEPKGLRRIIYEKMTKSKQIMPHFMVAETINTELITKSLNEFKEKGVKVTMTPFFVKAVAVALTEFPKFNAHFDEVNKRYIIKHGKFQLSSFLHNLQSVNSCSCFLISTYDVFQKIFSLCVQYLHQISPIIHNNIRF